MFSFIYMQNKQTNERTNEHNPGNNAKLVQLERPPPPLMHRFPNKPSTTTGEVLHINMAFAYSIGSNKVPNLIAVDEFPNTW